MSTDGKTDEELMALLRRGRQAALTVLVERYQNDLFRFCAHYLKDAESARELTQETFLRVFAARDRFDEARSFRPWVLRIARNLCLNELKRRQAVRMEPLDERGGVAGREDGRLPASAAHGPEALAISGERNAALQAALNSLDDESREIVELRFFHRMRAREIAAIVGRTEGAVRTRLHRILERLRADFAREREDL